MKHLSYRRIIALADDMNLVTQEEKSHLEQCSLCREQIAVLSNLDEKLADVSRVEPLVNIDDVGEMADKIFDRHHKPRKERSLTLSYFVISFFSAVSAVVLMFFILDFDNGETKESPGTGIEKIVVDRQVESSQKSRVPEFSGNTLKEMNEGESVSGQRYIAKALLDSVIVEENENYVTVRSGKLLFDIESGGDFVVNLNNIGLVRVLGTSFTVNVSRNDVSVNVIEGLVEMIDIQKGDSIKLAKGGRKTVSRFQHVKKRPVKVEKEQVSGDSFDSGVVESLETQLSVEMENLFQYEGRVDENFIKKTKPVKKDRYRFKKDGNLTEAEIRDLEFSLRFSNAPVAQLQQLFVLLSERGHYGSVIHYWRVYSDQINSKANPFLHEMHRYACEASIKLYLYDNGICRRYRDVYPDGPDPVGMEDHLNMAW